MANHRADRRAVIRRRPVAERSGDRATTAGRRRADGGSAHPRVRSVGRAPGRGIGLPPTAVGGAAVVLAAVGAVLVAPSSRADLGPASATAQLAPAPATRTPSVVSRDALDRRERAVSRDSRREGRADAAAKRLQQVTEKAAKQRKAALVALSADAEEQAGRIREDTWQLPVTPGVYHLTSRFGECSGLWSHCHTGLDFAAPSGTPIHAVAPGTITEVGYAGAYGNRTIMTLADGSLLWYCHQTAYTVTVGQQVVAGQVIGSVGSTGNTTGPHLHLEVRPDPDHPVDPYAALVSHGLHP